MKTTTDKRNYVLGTGVRYTMLLLLIHAKDVIKTFLVCKRLSTRIYGLGTRHRYAALGEVCLGVVL